MGYESEHIVRHENAVAIRKEARLFAIDHGGHSRVLPPAYRCDFRGSASAMESFSASLSLDPAVSSRSGGETSTG
jgi:hypothetical protein